MLSLVAAPAASADKRTFDSPGESQFTVPAGVTTLHLDTIGGAGGDVKSGTGGLGRRVQADIRVVPGEVLYVEVGSDGANGRGLDGAGGGGAAGVRLCSVKARSCPGGTDALQSRIAIAGGGGGAGGAYEDGGDGGDADQPGSPTRYADNGDAGTTTAGGKSGRGAGGAGEDGAPDSGGRGGSFDDDSGGSGGANGGGDGGKAGGPGEGNIGPGGGGGGGGYNGGGGGGASGDEQNAGAGGGGGGGASWVVSTATNVRMTWTRTAPSVTLTYTPAPTPPPPQAPPVVTALSPTSGPVTGGRTVTLTGSSFDHVRRVLFGSTAAPRFGLNGTSSLTVVVPPAASAGAVDVRVEGPGGLSAPSPAARFTYTARQTPRPSPKPSPGPKPSPKPSPTPSPQPAPPPACEVPNLIGVTLAKARKSLAQAGCAVGKVRKPGKGRRVRVYRQSVGAGTHLLADGPVDLWLRATQRRR